MQCAIINKVYCLNDSFIYLHNCSYPNKLCQLFNVLIMVNKDEISLDCIVCKFAVKRIDTENTTHCIIILECLLNAYIYVYMRVYVSI